MIQNNVYNDDTEDTTSEITVDSEVEYVDSSVAVQSQNNSDAAQINATGNFVIPALNVPPISQISSVGLQNSADVTFGNRMVISGPITVNQYGIENPSGTSNLRVEIPSGTSVLKTENPSRTRDLRTANPSKTRDLSVKPSPFSNRSRILVTTGIIVILLASIATATVLTLYFKNRTPGIDELDDTPLRLVTRAQWGALPATADLEDLILPVPLVIIQHTVQSTCDTMDLCAARVRQVQSQHINSQSVGDDIGYNFLVGGDGAAYEGRGWDKVGAHAKEYNSRCIGVAFIGNFSKDEPQSLQIVALLKLVRDGVRQRKISENYTLVGANQVRPTQSPGKNLIAILPDLPHWTDDVAGL